MALLGPMVVIAEQPATEVVDALDKAGAFPIVEATLANARTAIDEIQPCAILLADAHPPADQGLLRDLIGRIETMGLVMPVLALVEQDGVAPIPYALAVSPGEPPERMLDRLRSALRIRAMHATVVRRSGAHMAPESGCPFSAPQFVDQATVLCMGRGRSYPKLVVTIGERVRLIGAMSIESAARYLRDRDVEGLVIGDGFGPRMIEALLAALAENSRFRDLPVGVLGGGGGPTDERLPNLIHAADPELLFERLVPFVRLQAFGAHLARVLKSLESEGMLDPSTGLLAGNAFWGDLDRAVQETGDSGGCLSVARFSFEEISDHHIHLDAARLFSRLVRNIDFACQEQDGSILAAFTETDLRSAHIVARRIAAVLRHTMLSSDHERHAIKPTVTLATLKPTDNLSTLVARVGTYPKLAAG